MLADSGAKGQMIGPEGIEKLCIDLDVDPSDVSNSMMSKAASFFYKKTLCIPLKSIIFSRCNIIWIFQIYCSKGKIQIKPKSR